jgi:hypothetical protein
MGSLLKVYDLPARNERGLAEKLVDFARQVDQRLETPTTKTSKASTTYARAIEKGSNDKARRLDRHEALAEVAAPFLKAKT